MTFELPDLGYEYDSLEPHIDAKTMEIHHSKHHAGYVKKLNNALENHEELIEKDVKELVKNLNSLPEEVRVGVRKHGGGHLNHSIFWPTLKKDVSIDDFEEIKNAIEEEFGDFESFKTSFSEAAKSVFGSGWAWLIVDLEDGNKLKIVTTANQDNPVTDGAEPILGLDVWEHAYYLKYQNRRPDYIESFFKIINWERVQENYKKAISQ